MILISKYHPSEKKKCPAHDTYLKILYWHHSQFNSDLEMIPPTMSKIDVWKLFVLDRNTWYRITVQITSMGSMDLIYIMESVLSPGTEEYTDSISANV